MDQKRIIKNIRQFIAQESPDLAQNIEATSDLFELKIMDSFQTLNLVLHLEEQLGTSLDPSDLTEENFRSLEAISGLMLRYSNPSQ